MLFSQRMVAKTEKRSAALTALSTIAGLTRTSRPFGWVAAFTLYRIGMAYGQVEESPVTLGLSLALTFPFCLYLFGLNDLADGDSDRNNPRKGNWVHGASGPVQGQHLARVAPWVGGAIVATFIPLLPLKAAFGLAGILLLSWAYSSPPIRLKEVPIVDGLVTATIMIGLLAVGLFCGGSQTRMTWETVAVAPTLAGLHIFASVVDVDSDRRAAHRTLAVRAGPRVAGAVALICSLLTVGTIPFLNYAEPIVAYIVIQAIVIGVWTVIPHHFTARRAISVVGLVGLITLLYMALVYVRYL